MPHTEDELEKLVQILKDGSNPDSEEIELESGLDREREREDHEREVDLIYRGEYSVYVLEYKSGMSGMEKGFKQLGVAGNRLRESHENVYVGLVVDDRRVMELKRIADQLPPIASLSMIEDRWRGEEFPRQFIHSGVTSELRNLKDIDETKPHRITQFDFDYLESMDLVETEDGQISVTDGLEQLLETEKMENGEYGVKYDQLLNFSPRMRCLIHPEEY